MKTRCGRKDRVVGVTQGNSTTTSTEDHYKSASVESGSRYCNTQVSHLSVSLSLSSSSAAAAAAAAAATTTIIVLASYVSFVDF